jgi:uncharacterized SAM-binding protein YcdF (DUF218 family)
MLHTLSRLVDLLLDPANVLALLVVIGAALLRLAPRARLGGRLIAVAALSVVAFVLLPIPQWLTRPLEQRFPPRPLPARVDGIIVLGGAQQPCLSSAYGMAMMNHRAERMTTFVALARQHTEARLVFAGGPVACPEGDVAEAQSARMFLREQGIDESRVVFEDASRNTWENVAFAERKVQPKQGENWLAVVSAIDVPRTVGVFRRIGWHVAPVPVDYRLSPEARWQPALHLSATFGRTSEALHEWVGLFAYFLLDRTETLFPSP